MTWPKPPCRKGAMGMPHSPSIVRGTMPYSASRLSIRKSTPASAHMAATNTPSSTNPCFKPLPRQPGMGSRFQRPLHNLDTCHCYENSRPPPHTVIPAKSLPRTPIRGRYPVPALWIPVYVEASGRPIFIPLCGLRQAIVNPNAAERSEESKILAIQDWTVLGAASMTGVMTP